MNSPGLTGRKWKRLYFTWLGGSVIHPISNQWPCCCSSSKQKELDLSQTRVELLFHWDLIAFLGLIDSVWKWSELLNSRNGINITRQDDSWSEFQSLCTCTAFYCWAGWFEYKYLLLSVFERKPTSRFKLRTTFEIWTIAHYGQKPSSTQAHFVSAGFNITYALLWLPGSLQNHKWLTFLHGWPQWGMAVFVPAGWSTRKLKQECRWHRVSFKCRASR